MKTPKSILYKILDNWLPIFGAGVFTAHTFAWVVPVTTYELTAAGFAWLCLLAVEKR